MDPNRLANNDKFKVLFEYAHDLLNTGIIKNSLEFMRYVQEHGEPGKELQMAQQVIHNYCMGMKPMVPSAEYVEGDAITLCRLFPNYQPEEAQYLLDMFEYRPERVQLAMCIMLMHNRMIKRLQNIDGVPTVNNVGMDRDNLPDTNYKCLPQENTNIDPNGHTNIPKNAIFKRTPTATVVRPEDLCLLNRQSLAFPQPGPYLPNKNLYNTLSTSCHAGSSKNMDTMQKNMVKNMLNMLVQNPQEEPAKRGTWHNPMPYFKPQDKPSWYGTLDDGTMQPANNMEPILPKLKYIGEGTKDIKKEVQGEEEQILENYLTENFPGINQNVEDNMSSRVLEPKINMEPDPYVFPFPFVHRYDNNRQCKATVTNRTLCPNSMGNSTVHGNALANDDSLFSLQDLSSKIFETGNFLGYKNNVNRTQFRQPFPHLLDEPNVRDVPKPSTSQTSSCLNIEENGDNGTHTQFLPKSAVDDFNINYRQKAGSSQIISKGKPCLKKDETENQEKRIIFPDSNTGDNGKAENSQTTSTDTSRLVSYKSEPRKLKKRTHVVDDQRPSTSTAAAGEKVCLKRERMPRSEALHNHQRHNVSYDSEDSLLILDEPPKRRKFQHLESMIDLGNESDSSSYMSTDIEDIEPIDMVKNSKPEKAGASYCIKLCSHILEMFPDACPTYVRNLCTGREMTDDHVDEVLQIMFNEPNYPKRDQKSPTPPLEMDFETQAQLLKEIFPDADPTYLESQAQIYLAEPDGLKLFISKTLENRDYPTKKEYSRRQQLNAQVRQYTTEFDVDKFLEIIPDPVAYFNDPNRCTITAKDAVERHLCSQVFKNLYPHIMVRYVNDFVHHKNLILAAKKLDDNTNRKMLMKTKRKFVPVDLSAVQNIPLLQEIAFLTNRDEILKRVQEKKQQELEERKEAKANGLMQVCKCCYDEEVMLKDCATCENGCVFCKACIQRSVEILFSEGKTEFPCLDNCSGYFNLTTLRDALLPKLFSKVAQRKQVEEVKAAGIDDLVTCPFCDFATIPPPGDKIFKCLNPECMKESCRECKEPSHIPLRCDEIEKDDDVKKRTYIENKMTEALVRVCYKCGMKFIKEDGCNKMTCSCGAKMCYLCLAPVTDYTHFNGQGGDKHHLCPLYSDTNAMHEDQVMQGAAEAREELGVAENEKLKIDPTADVHKHYERHRTRQAQIPRNNHQHLPPPIHMILNAVMGIDERDPIHIVHRNYAPQHRHHRYHHHRYH